MPTRMPQPATMTMMITANLLEMRLPPRLTQLHQKYSSSGGEEPLLPRDVSSEAIYHHHLIAGVTFREIPHRCRRGCSLGATATCAIAVIEVHGTFSDYGCRGLDGRGEFSLLHTGDGIAIDS